MPFLLANDSIEILVPAGQKICVTSYGAGTAKIETATEPGNYPAAFSLLTSITNSDYTSSAFTRDTTVKITAGLCDAEYVAGANPFPTIHRITTDSNGNILLDGNSIIEVNNSTPALRITQLGSGHALLVEDEASPDSSPFVVNNVGNIGVGTVPSTWHSLFKAIQSGAGAIASQGTTNYRIWQNSYIDSSLVQRYVNNGFAGGFELAGGEARFYSAPSGVAGDVVTFNQTMTLDASGNLGIGAVPSAWSAIGHKALQLPALASYSAGYDYTNNISLNAVRVSGGGWNYMQSGIPSSLYQSGTGTHKWFVAPSGTAGNAITFNQAMTLSQAGNLQIGTTANDDAKVNISGGGAVSIRWNYDRNVYSNIYGYLSHGGDSTGVEIGNINESVDRSIRFSNGTSFATKVELGRFSTSGNLLLGTQTDSGFKLDVLGSARIRNGGLATGLILGADSNATTTTNATTKIGQICSPHYTNAEEPVGVIRALVDATSSTVSIGSGSGSLNNITAFDVYLGSSNTTTNGNIRFAIKNDGIVFTSQLAPDAVDANATLTTANLSKKIITSTTAAAVAGTLPTGTLMDGTFGTVSDLAFDWTVINTGPNTFTLSVGTGHTIVGNAAVATNTSGTFRSRRTGAATWVSYRIS